MKKSGCGKKPASKGYRMSCGGGVKRYAEGKKVKGKRPVPADVGARPDRPSPEVMQDMRSQRQAHQNMAKRAQDAQRRAESTTMPPEMQKLLIQEMRQKAMDRGMQEAARKPPNQRGYSNGGQIKRKLLKALMARRGR